MEQMVKFIKKDFDDFMGRITTDKVYHALNIQREIINSFVNFMKLREVKQLMPLMLSTETDPLNHSVFDTNIKYYENNLSLMKSMILHKQVILSNPNIDSIYIISPNVRLEKRDEVIKGRHLIEFTQIDFEFKNQKKEFVKDFMEDLYIYIISNLKKECATDLNFFERNIETPIKPFKTYDSFELQRYYGEDFEQKISNESTELFWIENFDRWFYDKESEENPGVFLNYDIIYPEGFGEGSSGAERETNYERLLKRMLKTNCNPQDYNNYLELIKTKKIPNTAGAGIGVERLLRYICGIKNVEEVVPFAHNAGEHIVI